MNTILTQNYENHKNSLTILPRPPISFSDEPEIVSQLCSKSSIELLTREKCFGFFICDSFEPDTISENISSRDSCLFIPAPNFSKIVLIKIIHDRSGENLETLIGNPITSQLNRLNLTFEKERGEKIPVAVLIIFKVEDQKNQANKVNKTDSNKAPENYAAILDQIKQFVIKNEFNKLEIEFHFILKNSDPALERKQKQKLKQAFADSREIPRAIKESIFEFLGKRDIEIDLQITPKKFKKIGSAEITLTDFDEVVYMYKLYFPAKDHRLEIQPSILQIKETLLYKTGQRGELLDGSDGYIGELKEFLESFVAKVSKPVGLLIKAYKNMQLNAILHRPFFNNRFDIDWIYCGHKMILAFEIGRTNSPENPTTAILNKLQQVLSKSLPTMYLALHAIFRSFPENVSGSQDDEEFSKRYWEFIKRCFRFVIFFPNLSAEQFVEILQTAKEPFKVGKQKAVLYRKIFGLISSTNENRLSNILFLLHEDLYSPAKPKTFYVDQDLKVSESPVQVTDVLQTKVNYRQPKLKYKQLEFVSGIFALSTLIEKEIFPSSVEKALIPRDENYLQERKRSSKQTKLEDNESDFLDVVLSPQQHRILSENKRRVFVAGEPGSGKTALLLARAKIAANDSKIEHILFAVPEGKTEFKTFLLDFVNKPGHEKLKNKFMLVTTEEMANPRTRGVDSGWPPLKQLHRSILLIDELYMTSSSYFSKRDQLLLPVYLQFLPHVQQFFITNVIAGQMHKRQGLTQIVLPHGCVYEPLNILFRSSHHISAFSTTFIHTTKLVTRTSARVSGCFTSPQPEVTPHYFLQRDDPIFSADPTLMNPCFASDRRAIIFSHDKTFWTEKFANERSDISHVSVVPPVIDFYKTPYTGCEALSVLVIVDHMLEAKHDTEMFIILNLAITRAQFEVMIIVKEKYRNRMEKFIRIPSRLDRILMHAGNQLPVDLTFLKTVEWTKDMTSFVQKLTRIAIQRSDERLLGSILDKVPAFRIPLDTILGALDEPKPAKFLDFISKRLGSQIRSRVNWSLILQRAAPRIYRSLGLFNVTGPMEMGIIAGFLSLMTWFLEMVGKNTSLLIAKLSGKLLFSAYYNGSIEVINWTIKFLSQFEDLNLVEKEVRGTYKFISEDLKFFANDPVTLLVLMVSQNFSSAPCAQILFDHGFPDTLLLHELYGKNALHYAIWCENVDFVHVLLKSEKHRRIFLSVLYNGMTAYELARSFDFDDIADDLVRYYALVEATPNDADDDEQVSETARLISQ